jgi:hypothetical protein
MAVLSCIAYVLESRPSDLKIFTQDFSKVPISLVSQRLSTCQPSRKAKKIANPREKRKKRRKKNEESKERQIPWMLR